LSPDNDGIKSCNQNPTGGSNLRAFLPNRCYSITSPDRESFPKGILTSNIAKMAIYENDEQVSMILIMGVTGSGKSYFINKLANGGAVVEGHSLKSSK